MRTARKQSYRRTIAGVALVALAGVAGTEGAAAAVEVPQVNTPKIELPNVGGGGSNLPSVPKLPSTPSVPGVSGGSGGPNVPSLPGSGSGGGGTSGAPSGGSSSSGATESGSPAPSTSSSATSAPTSSAVTSGGSGGGSGGSSGGGGPSSDSHFANAVEKVASCTAILDSGDRSVVVLRAGLFGRPPVSRSAVARQLDMSRARVRRVERRSLTTLRTAAQDGSCGRNAPPATMNVSAVPPLMTSAELTTASQPGDNETASRSKKGAGDGSGANDRDLEVLGARASAANPAATQPAVAPPAAAGGSGPTVALLILAVLAGVAAMLGGLLLLRRRRSEEHTAPAVATAAPGASQPVEPVPAAASSPEPAAAEDDPWHVDDPQAPGGNGHRPEAGHPAGLAESANGAVASTENGSSESEPPVSAAEHEDAGNGAGESDAGSRPLVAVVAGRLSSLPLPGAVRGRVAAAASRRRRS